MVTRPLVGETPPAVAIVVCLSAPAAAASFISLVHVLRGAVRIVFSAHEAIGLCQRLSARLLIADELMAAQIAHRVDPALTLLRISATPTVPAISAQPSGPRVPGPRRHTSTAAAARPWLTERESQVLRLIAGGFTTPEIGDELELSDDTIKTYIRRMCDKLPARNRAHLVAVAYRKGLLS